MYKLSLPVLPFLSKGSTTKILNTSSFPKWGNLCFTFLHHTICNAKVAGSVILRVKPEYGTPQTRGTSIIASLGTSWTCFGMWVSGRSTKHRHCHSD